MIFSPLLPTTYPPNPISNKSQNREVSASIGKLVKVPIKITLANVNITSGRHDRCNQFPFTSSCTVTALACVNSLSNS